MKFERYETAFPANIYLFQINNRNARYKLRM